MSYSIALTFDLQTGKVRALIFSTKEPLSDLFNYLKSLSPLPFGPMIIPTIALELQVTRFNETIKTCHDEIHDIEKETGMRQNNHPHEVKESQMEDRKSLDLIDVTRNLSGFLSRFAHLKMQAETGAYLVHQMQLSVEFLIAELEKMKEEKSKIDSQHDILSKLEEIESWFVGIQALCRYLTRRTKAQTQTVRQVSNSREYDTKHNRSITSFLRRTVKAITQLLEHHTILRNGVEKTTKQCCRLPETAVVIIN